jgi:DNA-binding response OmpR family regulator
MTAHILLIEPESKLAKFIALELKQVGYQVTELPSELPDLTQLQEEPPASLAIFDLKRLKFSGLETQRQIQAIAQQMPVIWLTTMDRDEVCQDFNQFDSEIKDHLLFKPFSIEELMLRIYTRLNR